MRLTPPPFAQLFPAKASSCRAENRSKHPASAMRFSPTSLLSRPAISAPITTVVLSALIIAGFPPTTRAGDILRGGATAGNSRKASDARANAGAEAANLAKIKAQDRLARTTLAVKAMQQMQDAARAAATADNVPNGLVTGGLKVLTGPNAKWTGANAPVQSGNNVIIKQTSQQALLNWETFNVGKRTTLTFDQKAGKTDSGKWIAFNRIFDPSGQPSKILGSIKADGQVYVINQNGIVFGGASQVNTRTFVASSLPINEDLINRGLLNLSKNNAEFLFSSASSTASVIVERGARISTPTSAEGSGGRVILAGATVLNSGSISTPSGQTILAAGLQIGFDVHSKSYPSIPGRSTARGSNEDPSLRGLDVYVGNVGANGGIAKNTGFIDLSTGSLIMAGRQVEQNGIVNASTTVSLNGRIDLLANYGAVPNTNYNPEITGQVPFLNLSTGVVRLGDQSVTRILPDYASAATTFGNKLPINSQINLQGNLVQLGSNAMVQAPNADVAIAVGQWRPAAQQTAEKFAFTSGQFYMGQGSFIDVAGSTDVFVPIANRILNVEFRGSELALSPLQRQGPIRGIGLTIDMRRSGTYNGQYWVGTPLGDATGFNDVIQKNVAQLTARGGTVAIQAGSSVVLQDGSAIDVSGGFYRNEGGKIQTSRLRQGARILGIADATPDQFYDEIYTATNTAASRKWGVLKTFSSPLAPTGGFMENSYLEGAGGGKLIVSAPAMVLDGELRGATVAGPLQLRGKTSSSSDIPTSSLPSPATLKLAFEGMKLVQLGEPTFFTHSPTPPKITFGPSRRLARVADALETSPVSLPTERLKSFLLPEDFYSQSGFSSIEILNAEGEFEIPFGTSLQLPEGSNLNVTGKNISIMGSIRSPGGSLSFTAHYLPPYQTRIDQAVDPLLSQPAGDGRSGTILLGATSHIDVSGLITDDRLVANGVLSPRPFLRNAGSIRLLGYNVLLPTGSELNVSGGLAVNFAGKYAYGDAGSLTVEAGQDPLYASVLGGRLDLSATVTGYAGKNARGGTLSIKAPLIQIGGSSPRSDLLVLDPAFFSEGGFQTFNLTGIGSRAPAGTPDPENVGAFVPAVSLAPGITLQPIVQSLVYSPSGAGGGPFELRNLLRPIGERPPVSISLNSVTIRNSFRNPATSAGVGEEVVVRGDIRIPVDSRIVTEPGGAITLRGSTVTVLGSLVAPGGDVTIQGANAFPLAKIQEDVATFSRATVFIGPKALLSAAGTAFLLPDPFGRRNPRLFSGGTISVAGNIVAAAGAVLDVSGSSAIKDLHPSELNLLPNAAIPVQSGLNTTPYALQTVPYRLDSNGGRISLAGSEMMFSDATLIGGAGGPSAFGGTLAVSSGRFYARGAAQFGSDINFIVTQNGPTLPPSSSSHGIGKPVRDSSGVALPGMGFFALESFYGGGFDSLDLGFNTTPGSGKAKGSNVEFRGPVTLNVPGALRLASGGIIRADSPVILNAAYLAVGQPFLLPLSPSERASYVPFEKEEPGVSGSQEFVTPTSGPGLLAFNARYIDIGTLVLKNTAKASFSAIGGDIRGSGSLNIRGDLTFTAAQIYPVTLADFSIFAYDPTGSTGSVTINRSGTAAAPLSAGGSLGIFASTITQGGTLLAPFGSITLGWDGVSRDSSGALITVPNNPVTGTTLGIPKSQLVTLASGSLTSVAGIDFASGRGLLVPFGLSPDGLTIIDPRGVDVTSSGLPSKGVSVSGESIVSQAGSTIDIRGGGELYASRWVSGIGGTINFLGYASSNWAAGTGYSAGDLVLYKKPGERAARTYSARVSIDPNDFDGSGPEPGVNRYWSEVAESYAVIPGFSSSIAPYAPFNSGSSATALGGNPGYVSGTLRLGDRVTLDSGSGLAAGTYTLLPRQYALLPGAFLITPRTAKRVRSYGTPDGAELVTGFRSNAISRTRVQSQARSLYEIVSANELSLRAAYETYEVSEFIRAAARRNELASVQYTPVDAGYLSLQGNTALRLDGRIASGTAGARGARIDISSLANIVIGGTGQPVAAGTVFLDAGKLSALGAQSLLVGGIRRFGPDSTSVDVRTSQVTVSNAGSPLTSPEIILVSREAISLDPGSVITAQGIGPSSSMPLAISGDGAYAGFSTSPTASIQRTGATPASAPKLSIGAGARLSGLVMMLDSSSGFDLSPSAILSGESYNFGAGQVALLLNGPTPLVGQTTPATTQLTLSGSVLQSLQSARSLDLVSYQSSIDIYGPGSFGASSLKSLNLQAGAIRGFDQAQGLSSLTAGKIFLSNSRNAASPTVGAATGSLVFNAESMVIGTGNLDIGGYAQVTLNSSGGILFSGTGGLFAQQALSANTPVLAVAQGGKQNFVARSGALELNKTNGPSTVTGGLGGSLTLKGATARVFSDITARSGVLDVESSGDVVIGGALNLQGSAQEFFDVTRYSDGGAIRLTSTSGGIRLEPSSDVSVSGHANGGNAGAIAINAAGGAFEALGRFEGLATGGARGGAFSLDAGSLASLETLQGLLNAGGFTEAWNLRLKTGDFTISGISKVRNYSLSADAGSIRVTGTIDASGDTGGKISLSARNNVTLEPGALLTVAAVNFSSAGKGGQIEIGAGASSGGIANPSGKVSLLAGSQINLSVAAYKQGASTDPNGNISDPTSSAFLGQFQGTLHLRAPRLAGDTDLGVDALLGTITGASSILVEGYRVYAPTGGVMNTALRNSVNSDAVAFLGAPGVGNANEASIAARLLGGGSPLAPFLVLAPGVEIVNGGGDLTLGLANPTGSTNAEATSLADWDLSSFRYGSKGAPGVLTLRAKGDLVFNNTLSDGLTPVTASGDNGHSRMWLAPLMALNTASPVNTQSWSYRLTAGADLSSSNTRSVLPASALAQGKGSILVGEFYPAIPNTSSTGTGAGTGTVGQTADTIRINFANNTDRGTRYEVVRTGTGDIDISAGRDVQLRNQFATIYTAGVALPDRTAVFQSGDFIVPTITRPGFGLGNPPTDGNLGAIQQTYGVWYAMAGGDVNIRAARDMGRFTLYGGAVIADTSRQIPTNWLYRRGFVDESGKFGVGGVDAVVDAAASTSWWIDYSNFFQGIGALGGGDITLLADRNIVNADVAIPTNARMAGRDPSSGLNLAPNPANLRELGGGNLLVRAGNNVDGGSFYVERGNGNIFAGAEVTTNSARTISKGILATGTPEILDPSTWMPTTLYVGKSSIELVARGNLLVGPTTNPFLLPQGMNNRFWYKTQFNTFSPTAGATVTSYGGSITHRLEATLPGDLDSLPLLYYWTRIHNTRSADSSSNSQPWLRLAESTVENYNTMFSVAAPNLRSTALAGDINVVGALTLFPSATGNLELLAAKGLPGLQKTGPTTDLSGTPVQGWTSAIINLSDANPANLPGVLNPLAFQRVVNSRTQSALLDDQNTTDPLATVKPSFRESGAIEGAGASASKKNALHDSRVLHLTDAQPLRLYAANGDVTGITLFSPKRTQVFASQDISDIAFFLQNANRDSVSIVSAGRDLILFNENSPLRAFASDINQGNLILDQAVQTTSGGLTKALSGDIQMSGPGALEVLAGRNIDLGTGANFAFGGLGKGITSIGRQRNPFLPFEGARLVIMAGIRAADGSAAPGLWESELDFQSFIDQYLPSKTVPTGSGFGGGSADFASLPKEQQAIIALDAFFSILKDSAEEAALSGSYETGYAAIKTLFPSSSQAVGRATEAVFGWGPWTSTQQVGSTGQIFTRVRDVRTSSGGGITMGSPNGGIAMAPAIFGNPLTPPGIVTEFGGPVNIFMKGSLNIGQARVFTLRGGDVTIWSSEGDIAAGASAKTVVTAPPTRTSIDRPSAEMTIDLGGLATGGGIGVLASVEGVEPGTVTLIAPRGTVDAGDAGIRATGDITIAAKAVLNADNIASGGTSTGVPSAPTVAAPNIGGLTSGSTTAAATSSAANQVSQQAKPQEQQEELIPSIISVEVLGYGGGEEEDEG